MEEFGMFRHGEKLEMGELRKSLEESGLSQAQQDKWRAALETLNLQEPEIGYVALPKIESMAKQICDQLPNEALVIFAPTRLPRARMTAELLSREITALSSTSSKNISVAFIWEPEDVAQAPESASNTAMYPLEMVAVMKAFVEQEQADDLALKQHLEETNPEDLGTRAYAYEDELIFKTANADLANVDSVLRKRADLLKEQVLRVANHFKDHPVPVYFYGVGHHQSLIALDIAFNGRNHYDSVRDMPDPLNLWKASPENLKELLKDRTSLE